MILFLRMLTPQQRSWAIQRAKTHVTRSNNCLLWKGMRNQYSSPLIETIHPQTKKRHVHSLRRIYYESLHNVSLTSSDYVSDTCGNPICLEPSHLKLGRSRALC